jgi:hypothetical protein
VGDELPTFTDTVRRKEAAFPSMVADAMLHEYRDYSPQFSIINGGFVRGNSRYSHGIGRKIRGSCRQHGMDACQWSSNFKGLEHSTSHWHAAPYPWRNP